MTTQERRTAKPITCPRCDSTEVTADLDGRGFVAGCLPCGYVWTHDHGKLMPPGSMG